MAFLSLSACTDQSNSDLRQELCSPRWQPTNNYPNTEENLKITAQKSLICQKKSPNLISECTMLKSQRLTIMYFTLIFRQRMKCSEIFPLSIPFPCVSLHLQMSLWWICLSHFWCSRGHIGQGKTELCQILGLIFSPLRMLLGFLLEPNGQYLYTLVHSRRLVRGSSSPSSVDQMGSHQSLHRKNW